MYWEFMLINGPNRTITSETTTWDDVNQIINSTVTPVNPMEIVNKAYVDSLVPTTILYQIADTANPTGNIIYQIGSADETSLITCDEIDGISLSTTNVAFISATTAVGIESSSGPVEINGAEFLFLQSSAGDVILALTNNLQFAGLQSGTGTTGDILYYDSSTNYVTFSPPPSASITIDSVGTGNQIIVNPGSTSPFNIASIQDDSAGAGSGTTTITSSDGGNTWSIAANNTNAIWNASSLKGVPISATPPTSGQVLYFNGTDWIPDTLSGIGTVTSVSVTTANGVSGSVATPTTTPAITLTLGAITPTSVNSITFSGSSTPALSVTGSSSISGSNTGDQTITLSGDASGSGTSTISVKVNAIESATTSINLSSATAPTNGQVLTATGATSATWQTPSSPTITLSGAVTGSGTSSITTSFGAIAANSVLANATGSSAAPTAIALSASHLLGMGSTGSVASIALGTGLSMSGDTLSATGSGGTVTSVSVTTANGVSGTVATATTTPAISLTLGAITPTSVNSVTISGSSTPTLAVTGTSSISGSNTGDQTITLSGAVTGSGTGAITTSFGAIAANTVLSNDTASSAAPVALALAASQLLGRGSSGNIAAIALGAGLAMTGTTLSATGSSGFTTASTNIIPAILSGTYTPSANMQFVMVILTGGGGGSGGVAGGAAGSFGASGGGGSGEVGIGFYSAATIGASQSYTIGAAGSAGSASAGNGGAGGTSTFGSLISVGGGSGGSGSTSTVGFTVAAGGAAGSGGFITTGSIMSGNDGGEGHAHGASGAPIPGYGAANPYWGGGNSTGFGAEANGAGSGGVTATTTSQAGIVGSKGQILIVEYIFT
jgi:hypothetical protein